jgi:predicted RNase H-like HicB family nuclease
MTDSRSFAGWAYITRAEDLPDCWTAHCLDYDIVSVGDSPQQALDMVREAVGVALADDLNSGRDPSARKAAPEDWQPLLRLFEKHTKVQVGQMNSHLQTFKEFAAPLTVVITQSQNTLAPNLKLDLDGNPLLAA